MRWGWRWRRAHAFCWRRRSEVYGDPLVHPQPESYWGNVNPIGPRGVYDEAKRFAEAMTMAYHRSHGVDDAHRAHLQHLWPAHAPDDGRVVPNFVGQALRGEPLTVYGDGKQTRSFCYVSDLVEGIYRLLLSDETDPVNVGNPAEFTIQQFAEVINRLTQNPAGIVFEPLPVDDPKQRQPDNTKARRILGWEPVVPLEEGMQRTISWFAEKLGVAVRLKRKALVRVETPRHKEMPTRLKVKNFKNLIDVDVRFGPFTCIAGANGSGKSNLFDAIQFLTAREPTILW